MVFLLLEGVVVVDRENLRKLAPAGLAGLILTGIHVGLPEPLVFLVLNDTGPISGNISLTLLVQAVGGPVAAMWFAQGVGTTPGAVMIRILQFAGISLAFWWMAAEAGRVTWRGPVVQFLVNLAWYTLVWMVHAYCHGRPRRSSRSLFRA